MRWASLPSALPREVQVPHTAAPQTFRFPLRSTSNAGAPVRAIPSFDHPLDRIQGTSLGRSRLNAPTPIHRGADAHSNSESQGHNQEHKSQRHGHKRSLSEKLKRLIIPTLPNKREIRHIDENVARSAAFSPPVAPRVGKTCAVTTKADLASDNQDRDRDRSGMISTDHLQVDIPSSSAPERPYRSPGTASFLVAREEWVGAPPKNIRKDTDRDNGQANNKKKHFFFNVWLYQLKFNNNTV